MGIKKAISRLFCYMGIMLVLFLPICATFVSTSHTQHTFFILEVSLAHATSFETADDVSLVQRIFNQVGGVLTFSAQVIRSVLDIPNEEVAEPEVPADTFVTRGGQLEESDTFLLQSANSRAVNGSLLINVPLRANNSLTVGGQTTLDGVRIGGALSVLGSTNLQSLVVSDATTLQTLSVQGRGELNQLRVIGLAALRELSVSADTTMEGALNARGGITTNGADIDLGAGRLFASNILNTLSSGSSNVTISGTARDPIISVRQPSMSTPNLEKVRARGGCAECITDADVVGSLTIDSGVINNTVIGSTTAASGFFTDITVTQMGTSTFAGSIDVTDGCIAIDGTCLAFAAGVDDLNDLLDVQLSSLSVGDMLSYDGSNWVNVVSSSLGLGDGTFLGLLDTPSSYIASAIMFTNAAATGITSSSNLVFDGTQLGIGTDSPITTLSVAGTIGVIDQNALIFYDGDSSNHVGFRASSTLSSNTVWTLPIEDGNINQILVTDGVGNLRFDDVDSIGGGVDTFLELTDTVDAFINYAIPFASSSVLTFSPDFVFDGTQLAIGTNIPTAELTVEGSVRFGADASTPGLIYDDLANMVAIGTDSPTEKFTLQGGSMLQKGGSVSDPYTPEQIDSINFPDNANDIKVVGSTAYVAVGSGGNEFRVVDVSDNLNVAEITSLNLLASANAIDISGRYAYVVTDISTGEFVIIDISNPSVPLSVASVNLPTSAFDVYVQGNYAYVVTGGTGDDFHIINISNPRVPYLVDSLELSAGANGVHVVGNYAYVAVNTALDEFRVIDVQNPLAAVEVGSEDLPGSGNEVFVEGSYAYVVTSGALRIINIATPTSPNLVGSHLFTSTAHGVFVAGDYAYVATAGIVDNFSVIDVSNRTSPVLIGQENLAAGTALSIALEGKYAYVVTASPGDDFHVIDISGIDVQSAYAHSFTSGTLSTLGNANIAGNIILGNGLRSGNGGIQTDGVLAVQGTSTSFFLGSVGVGTTSVSHTLTIDGDLRLTGRMYDSNNSAGTLGMVLQSTGTGLAWVATSTLGLGGGVGGGLTAGDIDTCGELIALVASYDTGTCGNLVFSESPTLGGTVNASAVTMSSTLSMSGTAANISLGSNYLSGDGGDEGIFVDGSGNVGIGTTTPSNILSISGNADLSGNFIIGTTTGATGKLFIRQDTATNSSGLVLLSAAGAISSRWWIDGSGRQRIDTGTSATGIIALNGAGTGNVGIGTTSPEARLDVYGAAGSSDIFAISSSTNARLFTVSASGNIGIGTSVPTFKLHVAGDIGPGSDNAYNLGAPGSDWGCLYYNSGTLGVCASDERLKENIKVLTFSAEDETALHKVAELQLRTFTYKSAVGNEYNGLIAQEVLAIAPELVVMGDDGFYQVKYGDIQWLVLQAVQEISETLTALKDSVFALVVKSEEYEERISELEEEVARLKDEDWESDSDPIEEPQEDIDPTPSLEEDEEPEPEENIEEEAPQEQEIIPTEPEEEVSEEALSDDGNSVDGQVNEPNQG